jgi:hypothetical protein
LNRLAFGAQLLFPTADFSEATKTLAKILDYVKINWNDIQDFVFQLNRPQVSTSFPDLGAINRLVKWQTIVRKKIIATIISPTPQAPVTLIEESAVYCEVDISTTAAVDPQKTLPPEQLRALVAELIHQASGVRFEG